MSESKDFNDKATNGEVTLSDVFDVDTEATLKKAGDLVPVLICLDKDVDVAPFVVRHATVSIGREVDVDLRVDQGTVSRRHASLHVEHPKGSGDEISCWLEDKGSTNGTFLNRKRVQGKVPVRNGDTLMFGRVAFTLSIRRESEMKVEEAVENAFRRYGMKKALRRIPIDMEVRLRIVLPMETFTPRVVTGRAQDLDLGGMRFITNEIDNQLWKHLIQREKFIRCEIQFPGESKELSISGRSAWIHFDNRTSPETCVLGIEFKNIDPERQEMIRRYLPSESD